MSFCKNNILFSIVVPIYNSEKYLTRCIESVQRQQFKNFEIILVEDKTELMSKLGKKQVSLDLCDPLATIPKSLAGYSLELSENKDQLTYTFDSSGDRTGITSLLDDLKAADIYFRDLNTIQSYLEDIFVNLVEESS